MSAETGGNQLPPITPNILLAEIEREQALKASKDSTKQVTQSVVKTFFQINGKQMDSEMDPGFFEELEKVLDSNAPAQASNVKLGSEDSAYKARINAVLRAYKAITGKLFKEVLSKLIKKSPLTKEQIAKGANISVGSLHLIRMRDGIGGGSEKTIRLLDKTLEANGQLILAYQSIVTEAKVQNVLNAIIKPNSFGALLRQKRTQLCLTRVDLQKKTNISQTRIRSWEEGIGMPPLTARSEIEALDKFLGCEGNLVELWIQGGPREHFLQADPYRLVHPQWPDKAKHQWACFLDFNTTNSQELHKEKPINWREGSVEKVLETIERFFGFLMRFKGFGLTQISMLLLCDWSLFKSFLEFVRVRTGRTGFTHTDEMMVAHYRAWLSRYFRFFWKDVTQDEYWCTRLPSTVTIKVELGHGYFQTQTYPLSDPEQKWSVVVSEALEKSLAFLKSTSFSNAHFHKLAVPFIKSKTPLEVAGASLEKAVNRLPLRITKRGIAVRVRRLAAATISLCRAFRTGTLRRLRIAHVVISGDQVSFEVPESIVKNAKPIEGPLPALPWVHRVLIRYIKEARPILVGANPDQLFLFTGRAGKQLPSTAIYADVRLILGVNPQAMRYVVVTDGMRNGASKEAMSKILVNTPEMIEGVYGQLDAEDENAVANQEVEKIFKRSKQKE